jgi:ADP-heptose:LPS heptosyltransferase
MNKNVSINGRRILVVKLADIGDAVLALPAIQGLRAAAPASTIDVLTTEAGSNVFSRSSAVDNVMTLRKQQFDRLRGLVSPRGMLELTRLAKQLRQNRYHVVILLHHFTTGFGTMKFRALVSATGAATIAGLDNGRGSFLTHRALDHGFGERAEWEYGMEIIRSLGIDCQATRPKITIHSAARASAFEILDRYGISEDYVVLHTEVGEFSPARAWPDNHFATLARQLQETRHRPIVLVGVDPARTGLRTIADTSNVYNLCGKTDFSELCALIDGASLVIGGDSSVTHLAAAFDRPLISLFGPSNVAAWRPYGSQTVNALQPAQSDSRQQAVTRHLSCSPCIYRGFSLGRPAGCPSRRCMTELLPEHVVPLVHRMDKTELDGFDPNPQPGSSGEN